MANRSRRIAQAAVFAALYAALTYLQNLLLPGSATWAIQLRLSEALCVFSFFTPAAPAGLALGCLIFNLCYSGALPLDFLVGTLATWLACSAMGRCRRLPWLALSFPALTNAVLVGWELWVYIGGAFWLNALYVALGELIVLYVFGSVLYLSVRKRRLERLLFRET